MKITLQYYILRHGVGLNSIKYKFYLIYFFTSYTYLNTETNEKIVKIDNLIELCLSGNIRLNSILTVSGVEYFSSSKRFLIKYILHTNIYAPSHLSLRAYKIDCELKFIQ